MIDIKNPLEVYEMDLETLWKVFRQLAEETHEYDDIKKKVELGTTVKYPIQYLFEEWYELYPSSKRAKIIGYGKFSIKDFIKDKEERERLMRETILDELYNEKIEEPRTK